jgi:hypothetical protein
MCQALREFRPSNAKRSNSVKPYIGYLQKKQSNTNCTNGDKCPYLALGICTFQHRLM